MCIQGYHCADGVLFHTQKRYFFNNEDRITSPHSSWKHPNNSAIIFNSFLRIQVDEIQ